MPVFIDYRYVSNTFPSTGSWSAISNRIERRHPPPVAFSPPSLPSPSTEAVADCNATPADLWWSVRTTGHGSEAEMAVRWYLNSKPLTKPDLVELSKFTTARTDLVMSVFNAKKAGAAFTHLTYRPFLELLDLSEKVAISYLIGCGMAGLSGPAALKTRTPGTPIVIKRLFHASLFRAHTSLFDTARLDTLSNSKPDFVAFDELDQIHIFEAKASFVRPQYAYIVAGLQQVAQVIGITFPHPAPGLTISAESLNVCFAFHSSKPVSEWPTTTPPVKVPAGGRCVVMEYLPSAHLRLPVKCDLLIGLKSQLLGLQIIGRWIALLSAERIDVGRIWSVHHFKCLNANVAIGVPTSMLRLWNAHIETLLEPANELKKQKL